jgi:UDP-3-O-[3-hydroxymyristoyl] glucosamine N-acyltransferase
MTTLVDVARALQQETAHDLAINGVSTVAEPRPETLSFISAWSADAGRTVVENPRTAFLVPEDADCSEDNVVKVARPRLAYALVLRDVLADAAPAEIASTAAIESGAVIEEGVSIGHFAVIETGAVVRRGARIDHHAVLRTGVEIGERSRIGSHTSIGGTGFGFEMDDNGDPIRIGHRGGVVIGRDVEIGQHCSIAQGTIEPTRLDDHVKVDDCVFIAHNVRIGRGSFVIAGAEISGSVRIGERVWISPEVTIINKVAIGDDALVGIGAVVVRDVDANTVVAGVPAKPRGLRHQPAGETPT